jgi:hypothetical protein
MRTTTALESRQQMANYAKLLDSASLGILGKAVLGEDNDNSRGVIDALNWLQTLENKDDGTADCEHASHILVFICGAMELVNGFNPRSAW